MFVLRWCYCFFYLCFIFAQDPNCNLTLIICFKCIQCCLNHLHSLFGQSHTKSNFQPQCVMYFFYHCRSSAQAPPDFLPIKLCPPDRLWSFPPVVRLSFNCSMLLQALKVLSFNASVTIFFHPVDCCLPGRLHFVCTCMRVCHFWKHPWVLSAPVLLQRLPGQFLWHCLRSCCGWTLV